MDKKLWEKTVNKYFSNGNEKKSVTLDLEGNSNCVIIYKYQYDKQGNWINKISISNGKPSLYYEREISYY